MLYGCVPKEQTVQLALKESQLHVRMTIVHNKTRGNNIKALLFQIEKFKASVVLTQNLSSTNHSSTWVYFKAGLVLGPFSSEWDTVKQGLWYTRKRGEEEPWFIPQSYISCNVK